MIHGDLFIDRLVLVRTPVECGRQWHGLGLIKEVNVMILGSLTHVLMVTGPLKGETYISYEEMDLFDPSALEEFIYYSGELKF